MARGSTAHGAGGGPVVAAAHGAAGPVATGPQDRPQLRTTELKPGDILLLLVLRDTVAHVTDWLGVLPLVDRGLAVTQDSKTWLAIAMFAVCGGGLLRADLPAHCAWHRGGRLCAGQDRAAVGTLYPYQWPVIVLLGSMIPLGAALETWAGPN